MLFFVKRDDQLFPVFQDVGTTLDVGSYAQMQSAEPSVEMLSTMSINSLEKFPKQFGIKITNSKKNGKVSLVRFVAQSWERYVELINDGRALRQWKSTKVKLFFVQNQHGFYTKEVKEGEILNYDGLVAWTGEELGLAGVTTLTKSEASNCLQETFNTTPPKSASVRELQDMICIAYAYTEQQGIADEPVSSSEDESEDEEADIFGDDNCLDVSFGQDVTCPLALNDRTDGTSWVQVCVVTSTHTAGIFFYHFDEDTCFNDIAVSIIAKVEGFDGTELAIKFVKSGTNGRGYHKGSDKVKGLLPEGSTVRAFVVVEENQSEEEDDEDAVLSILDYLGDDLPADLLQYMTSAEDFEADLEEKSGVPVTVCDFDGKALFRIIYDEGDSIDFIKGKIIQKIFALKPRATFTTEDFVLCDTSRVVLTQMDAFNERVLIKLRLRGGASGSKQVLKRTSALKFKEAMNAKNKSIDKTKLGALGQVAELEKKFAVFQKVVESSGAIEGFKQLLAECGVADLDTIAKEISKHEAIHHTTEAKLKKASVAMFGTPMQELVATRDAIDDVLSSCEMGVLYAFNKAGAEHSKFDLRDLDGLVSLTKAFQKGKASSSDVAMG